MYPSAEFIYWKLRGNETNNLPISVPTFHRSYTFPLPRSCQT